MTNQSPSNPQRTRNCHWVPQSYLSGFAILGDPNRIWRLSNKEGEAELKLIEKVAYRHHLYSVRDRETQQRDGALETRLSELERMFGHTVWKQLRTDVVDIGWEPLRKMVALLAAVMLLRNPRTLAEHHKLHKELIDYYDQFDELPDFVTIGDKRMALDKSSWPEFKAADAERIKSIWFMQIRNAVPIAEKFLRMRWSMMMAPRPAFITSDSPITITNPAQKSAGIDHPKTRIYFPISPTRMLCMDHLDDEPANQYYPADDEDYTFINVLIWQGTMDHLFSHRHPDEVSFEMVSYAEASGFA